MNVVNDAKRTNTHERRTRTMDKCRMHWNALPCQMRETEQRTNGVSMTRFYRKHGKVVMDVKNGLIAAVQYCQSGDRNELIGHSPSEFQASW